MSNNYSVLDFTSSLHTHTRKNTWWPGMYIQSCLKIMAHSTQKKYQILTKMLVNLDRFKIISQELESDLTKGTFQKLFLSRIFILVWSCFQHCSRWRKSNALWWTKKSFFYCQCILCFLFNIYYEWCVIFKFFFQTFFALLLMLAVNRSTEQPNQASKQR